MFGARPSCRWRSRCSSRPDSTGVVLADAVKCDMSQYKAASGLTASVEQDALVVTWGGENNQELRARFAIDSGTPTVRELAVRKAGGQWGHGRAEPDARVSRRQRHPPPERAAGRAARSAPASS